jgi:hypothetical protein
MEFEFYVRFVMVLIKVIDAVRVEKRRSAFDSVDFVACREKEFD